jgi:excisionase family DNA binding protein
MGHRREAQLRARRDMICRRSSSTGLAIAVPLQDSYSSDEDLLSPREVAEVFGIRPRTVARWARTGRLSPARTLGGHRRYARAEIRALLGDEVHEKDESPPTDQEKMEEDAARLYNQGWSIRQVAAQFGFSYSVMHRVLRKHTTLRSRSGLSPVIHGED